MKVSDVDKAKIGNLVLEGKIEEAIKLAEKTRELAEETAQLLEEKEQQIAVFLTHAPQEAKDFFSTMSPEEQQHAMKHIEYLPTEIRFFDDTGKEICAMENKDYTVSDSELEPGMIEKDEAGNMYFSFDAIKDDELVPTDDDFEQMLKVMPAGDYTGKHSRSRAGRQLHALLGGKLSGLRSSGNTAIVEDYGCFWSRSAYFTNSAFVLESDEVRGGLDYFGRLYLRPVRRLVRIAR